MAEAKKDDFKDLSEWVLGAVSYEDTDLYNKWSKLFEFVGFNWTSMARKMRTCETDKATFDKDMQLIITFGVERGNNIAKASKRMSDEGRAKMAELMAKYQIQVRPNQNDTITIPRVMAMFPWIAVKYSMTSANSNYRDIVPLYGYELKPAMMNPYFASMIPRNSDYRKTLEKAFLAYDVPFTKVINPKMRKVSNIKIAERQRKFLRAAIEGAPAPDKVREEYLVRWSVLSCESVLDKNGKAIMDKGKPRVRISGVNIKRRGVAIIGGKEESSDEEEEEGVETDED